MSPGKTNNLPDYPRIGAAELSGLQLDPDSARHFERRFARGLLGGGVLAFGGCAGTQGLFHFGVIEMLGFAIGILGSFVVGLALSLWTHQCMMRAQPRSARSGRLMQPFIIHPVDSPDVYEIVSVDKASGTYFRRNYVEHGG